MAAPRTLTVPPSTAAAARPAPLAGRATPAARTVAPSRRTTPRGGMVNPRLLRAAGRQQAQSMTSRFAALPPPATQRARPMTIGEARALRGNEEPASLFGQINRLVTGVPQGLVGFGADVLTDIASPVRVAADVVGGHGVRGFEDYLPATTGLGRSMVNTGERVGSAVLPTVGERHDWDTYGAAVREGRIVESLVEDVGNVALAGGAAAKALGTTATTVGGLTADQAAAMGARRSVGAMVAEEVAGPVGRIRAPATPLANVADLTRLRPPTATYEVTLRGRGLAGMAERAGMEGTARTLARTGQGIRTVARLGEKAGNVPAGIYSYPIRKVGQLAGIEPGVVGRAVSRLADRPGLRGALFPRTTEGRTLGAITAGVDRSATDASRFVLDAARTAKERGLSEAEGRAVGLSLDQPAMLNTARTLADDELTALLDRMYPGVPEGQRPTVDDVRTSWAYADRSLPAETLAGMDMVRDRMQQVADTRTEAMLGDPNDPTSGLNPEQLGDELRPTIVNRERAALERTRDIAQRQWESADEAALRQERISAATDAVAAELPPPPVAKTEFEAGRRVGKEEGRDSIARRAHAAATSELNRAVDEYIRLAEGPPSEAVQRAAAEVDRLTERAEEIRQLVERSAGRVDVATGASRASGEFDVTPGGPRPEPELTPVKGEPQAIRKRAKELGEQQATEIFGEIEQLTNQDRPALPPPRAKAGGEYDFWWELDASTRRRLQREGWFTGRSGKGGRYTSPDQLAETINAVRGSDLNPNEAMGLYIDAVRRYWDAKAGKGSAPMVELIANDMGIAPDRVTAALRGRIAEYGELLTGQARDALDDLRNDYAALAPDERQSFDLTASEILADPNASAMDFGELLEAYLPGTDVMGQEGVMSVLDNMADMREVIEWMRGGGELPPTITARLAERGPAQYRQLGRLAGDAQGARALARENVVGQRGARNVLDAAERTAATAERRAVRRIEGAQGLVDRTAPEYGPKLSEVIAADPERSWKRTTGTTNTGETTNPMSPGERMRVKQGVELSKAHALRARANRLRRAIDNANEKIATIETELGRSLQDRLVDDLNRPAVVRWRGIVDRSAPTLGNIVGRDEAMTLTGLTRRLAAKYGIFDDVLQILDSMREDMRAQRMREAGYDEYTADMDFGELTEVVGQGGVQSIDIPASEVGAVIDGVLAQKRIIIDTHDRIQLDDAIGKGTLLEDMAAVMFEETSDGRRLNAPLRVADVINQAGWHMPDDARSKLQTAMDRYGKQRADRLTRVYDVWAEALPARFRTASQTARRQIGALMEMAEEANTKRAGTGDIYLEMAEETANTLADMVEAGLDPTHLTGGREATAMSSATASRGSGLGAQRTRGERRRRTGLRQLGLDAYARVEAETAMKMITGRRNEIIGQRLGRRVDQIPEVAQVMREWSDAHNGEVMPAVDAAKRVRDAGWVPMEDGAAVGPQTIVVPKAVKDALRPSTFDNSLARAIQRGNQAWKTWVLPFSPKWMVGNVIGNVIQSAVHGGVGPVELARRMVQLTRHEGGVMELWRRSGLPDWTPNEIANHGLTFHEYRILKNGEEVAPRTPIGRVANTSYRLNEFVDNMTRSSVYLSKLMDGVPTEAALQSTLRALGDFSNMSSFERRIVREVFPFYAWMRHSITATLRLPITSPTRAAMVLNLSRMYSDPDMENELLGLLGSKLPLSAASAFDFGSVSPLAEIGAGGFPLDPRNLVRSMSPIVKVPTSIGFGLDVNNMTGLSRPPDTASTNAWGQKETTSPLSRLFSDPQHALGEIAYVATSQAPAPIRNLRQIILGDEARYDTGYAVGDLRQEGYSRLSHLLRGLNLPAAVPISAPSRRG